LLFGVPQRLALTMARGFELPAPKSKRDFELLIRKARLRGDEIVQRCSRSDAIRKLGLIAERLADRLELAHAEALRFAQHRACKADDALESDSIRVKELLLLGCHEEPPGVSESGDFNIRRRLPREQGQRFEKRRPLVLLRLRLSKD
jgi:hypothetical protein